MYSLSEHLLSLKYLEINELRMCEFFDKSIHFQFPIGL